MNIRKFNTLLVAAALAIPSAMYAQGGYTSNCNVAFAASGKTFSATCVSQAAASDPNTTWTFENTGGITYYTFNWNGGGSCWYQEPGTYAMSYYDTWVNHYEQIDLPF